MFNLKSLPRGAGSLGALMLSWAAFSVYQGAIIPAAAVGLLLLVVALVASPNGKRIDDRFLLGFWALLGLALVGAWAHHPIPAEAPLAVLPLLALAAGLTVGVNLPPALRGVALGSIGLCAVLALAYGAPDRIESKPLESWFYDYNSTATLMNMGIFALIATGLFSPSRALRGLAYLGAVLLVMGVLWSASRGAVLVMAAGFVAFAIVQRHLLLHLLKRNRLMLAPFVAVPAAGLFFLGEKLMNRMRVLGADESYSGRLDMWRAGVEMAQSAPSSFFGHGFLRWEFLYPAYRRAGDFESLGVHAHGDYVELLAIGGTLGLIIGIALVAIALWTLWRSRAELAGAAVAVGALTVLLHSAFNFPLQNAALTLPLGLMLGLALRFAPRAAHPSDAPANRSVGRWPRWGGAAMLALSLPFTTLLALEWTVAAAAFQPGSFAATHLPNLGKLSSLERLYGPSAERALGVAPASAIATHYTLLAFGDKRADPAIRAERLTRALRLIERSPTRTEADRLSSLAYPTARGIAEGIAPHGATYEELLADLERASAMWPGHTRLPIRIAQIKGMAFGPEAERHELDRLVRESRVKPVVDAAQNRLRALNGE